MTDKVVSEMKPNCQEPTCFNCSKEKKCDRGDGTINCIRHPKAREYLLQDVIQELERLYDEHDKYDSYGRGMADAYDRAISLIKEVKK
jgi:hypothetical protein